MPGRVVGARVQVQVHVRGLDRDGHPGRERRGRDHRSDLRRERRTTAGDPADPAEPVDRRERQAPEAGHAGPDRAPALRARPQVRLQRAPLVEVERAGCQPLHGDAVEPVAEDEVLGHAIARREEGLLDLRHCHPELRGGLVDAKAVQLAEDVDASLPLRQCGQRGDEGAGFRRAVRGRPIGELGRRQLAPSRDDVDRRVVSDAEEPGPEPLRELPGSQGPVCLQERRLRDVVPGCGVAEQVRPVGGEARRLPRLSSESRLSRNGLTSSSTGRRTRADR
jgi:hypothetical protein